MIREQNEDYWVQFILDILLFFPDEWDYVLIPDCRFPNEVYLPKMGHLDAVHIRVVRPDFDNGLTPEQKTHPSETALDDWEPDFVFCNNGSLCALRGIVEEWIDHCAPWLGTRWFVSQEDKASAEG